METGVTAGRHDAPAGSDLFTEADGFVYEPGAVGILDERVKARRRDARTRRRGLPSAQHAAVLAGIQGP